MYELYIANKNYSSWSLRPWVLMQELGIPFTERLVPFIPGSNRDQFRAFSPSGRVPCLVENDVTVWDSLAIAEYLHEKHSLVWPEDTKARTFARCATAEMHSGFGVLRDNCSMSCGVRVQLQEISAALKADIERIDEIWCEGLARFGGPFLAGNHYTAMDAFYAPVVFRVLTYGLPLSPPAQAYADRMLLLPSMKAWYESALTETWRDEAHELDINSKGVVTKDLRR